jgi:D-alanyl-D-alanine carboxypeptidase
MTHASSIDALSEEMSRIVAKSGGRPIALTVGNRDGTVFDFDNRGTTRFLTASISKTFFATIALTFVAQSRLALDAPMRDYLPNIDITGLCRFRGQDYSSDVLVSDLLAHTSGVPDYYPSKRLSPLGDVETTTANDPGWTLEDAIEIARGLPARFPPHSGRSAYSFTNYQLLGAVLETVHGASLSDMLNKFVVEPLGLTETELLTFNNLELFKACMPLRLGSKNYRGARRMASLGAEGAIVSSGRDLITFARALRSGELIPTPLLETMVTPRGTVFPGVSYGLGVMEVSPRLRTRPWKKLPTMQGHMGATGSFLLWFPHSDVIFAGTSNQLFGRKTSRAMIEAAASAFSATRT